MLSYNNITQLKDSVNAGAPVDELTALKTFVEFYKTGPGTLVPLLGLLNLKGQPYSLKDHFTMEPLFKMQLPRRMLFKCARQISKTTSLAASSILRAACQPHLAALVITPRFEQLRRISSNYFSPFMTNSPIVNILTDEKCTKQVLQRTFSNGSSIVFSFAFLDCDRVRGLSCDWIDYDEVQDLDYEFLPIIHECMSASKLRMSMYSGTPKTLDNTIQALWEESSQAEWVIPCASCGKWNMATVHEDLIKMIGRKTLVCAKCQNPINARAGRWYHTAKDHMAKFQAYHIPQPVMPMHYEDPEKWGELIDKRDGKNNYDQSRFYNEVLGESCDVGNKLVTITDIKKASTLGVNELEKCIDAFRRCTVRTLGVDWGGGGEDGVSSTVASLVGLRADGKIGCYYCVRFHAGFTHDEEARALLRLFREGCCHYFAHDYGGSGSVRETLMIQAGLPIDRIMNFMYVRATTRNMVHWNPPHPNEMRGYFALDKARSLVLQATCIKGAVVALPEYESSKNITHDLLALLEDKHEMPRGADIYLVRKQPKIPDDFAHSLNYGCVAIWDRTGRYPDLSSIQGIKLTAQQLSLSSPPDMEALRRSMPPD
jgi:hypothetical protein